MYLKNMIFKLESFIKRIKWKAFFYEKSDKTPEKTVDNFGFKSAKTTPKNEHLNAFEADLVGYRYNMVRYASSNLRELVQNSKVTNQKISNALMKTHYFLFLLTKQTTCVRFLKTIITNY